MPMWIWAGETARRLRATGQDELAEAVTRLPQLAEAGDAVKVEASARSAMRVARRLVAEAGNQEAAVPGVFGPPTLFFLAHWPLAVRVGALGEGHRALDQARAVVRDEPGPHEHGPMPVSALASLVRCHANIDSRGTTQIRRELLSARSLSGWEDTPAWPAFTLARVHLLIDEEQADRAEAELRRYEHTATGPALLGSEGVFALVRALRHQDKHTDALDALDRMEAELELGEGRGAANPRRPALVRAIRFERARLLSWLARLGLCDARKAIALLPTVDEAEACPNLRPIWAEAVENLVCQGSVRNDWRLGARVTTWSRYFERVGAPRRGAEMALTATRLAGGRGAHWVAECSALRAERLITELGAAEEISGDLTEARAMVRGMNPIRPLAPASNILEFLRAQPAEDVDPEEQAEQVNVALAALPHDSALLSALGQVGRTLMLSDAATEPQWRHVREQPGDQRAALSLLETLLHDNDTGGVRDLVRTLAAGALPTQGERVRSASPEPVPAAPSAASAPVTPVTPASPVRGAHRAPDGESGPQDPLSGPQRVPTGPQQVPMGHGAPSDPGAPVPASDPTLVEGVYRVPEGERRLAQAAGGYEPL
ncbi:hypothetical protein [Nocardiopsis sp. JB363]|uniref:hypothetical protein n=1 Tax=Nocardiopsis sp. JB363 TaxID=1434837 RepID=UPI000979CA01|nr:hypothetical protein [Nocardiopsis sp. JB363]SIO89734.1 FOG: TPR repeat [Nocardiopsis sp. JB363]